MFRPATHFAPTPRRLPRSTGTHVPTLVSVTALVGVPAFVRDAFGETVLRHATRAVMLDLEAIEDRDCFIPHATMMAFLAEIERRAAEPALGLLLAPHLSLDNYGCWGHYILGGETFEEAINRSIGAIDYHSRGDRVALAFNGPSVGFCYLSAAREHEGYPHVAVGAIGVILSLCRTYLSPRWRPLRIDLDIPRPQRPAPFEDVFQCPVNFGAAVSAVWFERHLLAVRREINPAHRLLTIEDVARARLEPASRSDLIGAVSAHIHTQMFAGDVSIESTAHALETSTRSLQRALRRDGTDFRTLVNLTRSRRARELIAGTHASISEIAAELGYNAPANFARAFRKDVGMSPSDFRQRAAGSEKA